MAVGAESRCVGLLFLYSRFTSWLCVSFPTHDTVRPYLACCLAPNWSLRSNGWYEINLGHHFNNYSDTLTHTVLFLVRQRRVSVSQSNSFAMGNSISCPESWNGGTGGKVAGCCSSRHRQHWPCRPSTLLPLDHRCGGRIGSWWGDVAAVRKSVWEEKGLASLGLCLAFELLSSSSFLACLWQH